MTEQEIMNIEINDHTIGWWICWFDSYSRFGKLHIVCSDNGNIIIKCMLKKDSVYEEIFNNHYSEFGTLLNSMRFFRQIFTQR